ncbi:tyrosine-type recombinase/integrase [Micromonospora sp. NPDC051296]|uniref:tyrosine-type recombinase/integrase n=1 Tax=Micromonospora sp. NPDC051296 TaxID=3155046 RepID=UPI0034245E15
MDGLLQLAFAVGAAIGLTGRGRLLGNAATASGGRLDQGAVWRLLRRHARAAGVPVTLRAHVLRRTCGTRSRNAEASLKNVQNQLGHATARTTRRYDHSAPDSTAPPPRNLRFVAFDRASGGRQTARGRAPPIIAGIGIRHPLT